MCTTIKPQMPLQTSQSKTLPIKYERAKTHDLVAATNLTVANFFGDSEKQSKWDINNKLEMAY